MKYSTTLAKFVLVTIMDVIQENNKLAGRKRTPFEHIKLILSCGTPCCQGHIKILTCSIFHRHFHWKLLQLLGRCANNTTWSHLGFHHVEKRCRWNESVQSTACAWTTGTNLVLTFSMQCTCIMEDMHCTLFEQETFSKCHLNHSLITDSYGYSPWLLLHPFCISESRWSSYEQFVLRLLQLQ